MVDTALPVVELAEIDEIVEGVPVTWQDPDGTLRTGKVVDISGLSDSPPTVSIAPDDDSSNPIDVPVEEVEIYDAAADAAGEDGPPDLSEIKVGVPVTWQDEKGNLLTGIVANIDGLADTPATVSVAPDDDPSNPIDVPAVSIEVYDPAEDNDDAGADDADEADGADADGSDDVGDAEDDSETEPAFDVVEGHPGCVGNDAGPVAVVIYQDGDKTGAGTVDSCWPDTDSAQAHIEDLLGSSGSGSDPDSPPPMPDNAPPSDPASGMSELERAARLAAQVKETLDLLHSINPEIETEAPVVAASVSNHYRVFGLSAADVSAAIENAKSAAAAEPNELDGLVAAAKEERAATAEGETLAVDAPLADVSDDELIAELARRYAEGLIDKLAGPGDAPAADPAAPAPEDAAAAIEGGSEAAKAPAAPAPAAPAPAAPTKAPAKAPAATVDCPTCKGTGKLPDGTDCSTCKGTGQVPADSADKPPAAASSSDFDWEGVLIVEGLPSGDGRMIAENALTWRELPVPLMLQTINAQGHDGAIICGSIHEINREGQNILGFGMFDSGAAGQEALRLLTEGTMRGVSADIDSVVVEFLAEDGSAVAIEDVMSGSVEAMEVLVEGRIMGATLTPFPAFQEAHVQVISSSEPDAAMVASGAEYRGDVWRIFTPGGVWAPGTASAPVRAAARLSSLVASAAADEIVDVPVNPPAEWFEQGEMAEPQPFTVDPSGRCFGLVAKFGSCHIGFTDRCVDVPRSASAYKHFRNKAVKTEEGNLVATGPIFMDTVHPNLRLIASDAQAHYADTGCAVADVALYENEFGIVAAGALRPGLTEAQVRRFRGSDVSPDWRQIGGRLEVVGLLSVNVSGFVVEGLVASGAEISLARGRYDSVSDKVTALVAAGMIHRSDFEAAEAEQTREALHTLTDQVTEMHAALEEFVLAPAREKRLADAREALGLKDPSVARSEKAASLLASMGIEAPAEESEFSLLPEFRSAGGNRKLAEGFARGMAAKVASDCGGACGSEEGSCSCKH